MLKLHAVSTGYGKRSATGAVLQSLSCTIPANKITVLVGPNGSGKSTLLKTICGFLPLWSGSVLLQGRTLSDYSLRERAQRIAYVGQNSQLAVSRPDVTVRELVLHGRFPYLGFPRRYSARDQELTEAVLCQLHLEPLAERALCTLSGGQLQKAYLAMALCQQTPLLVLDEPLTFLDIRQQLDLLHTLATLRAEGKTICLVVHDLQTALTFADTLLVLSGGAVVAQGAPATIAAQGVIDTVFSIHTECISSPHGGKLYTFAPATEL